ncbi:MAG TPA: AraC family transcriptional regulator [Clostridia bacterium]|nr:AraC family transcriptional regulator [Clostridia bacterium]
MIDSKPKGLRKRSVIKSDIVKDIDEYVSEHICEKIVVIEIAEHLQKNPSYLNYKFKLRTGLCITEYIQRKKIGEAKKRLIQTDNTITEICTELSYYDQSHFIRCFKKETGLTPLRYRELNLANSELS